MEQIPQPLIATFIFIFGLIVGSFLNVVIHRLPRRESVVTPGSHCPGCNSPIAFYDNIPVLSYLLLRGRCRKCKTRISPVYPAVELLVAVLFLLVYLREEAPGRTAIGLVFVSLIVPLVFIDLRHKILPDLLTKPGLVFMLAASAVFPNPVALDETRSLLGLNQWPHWAVGLTGAVLGALAGGGSLWLIREAYWRLRKIEGMGLGDVKMMLMVGAFLGWRVTILSIFIASLLGSIVGITLMKLRGGNMRMEIPFGVFLGPASLISYFVGQQVIEWYLGFYR